VKVKVSYQLLACCTALVKFENFTHFNFHLTLVLLLPSLKTAFNTSVTSFLSLSFRLLTFIRFPSLRHIFASPDTDRLHPLPPTPTAAMTDPSAPSEEDARRARIEKRTYFQHFQH